MTAININKREVAKINRNGRVNTSKSSGVSITTTSGGGEEYEFINGIAIVTGTTTTSGSTGSTSTTKVSLSGSYTGNTVNLGTLSISGCTVNTVSGETTTTPFVSGYTGNTLSVYGNVFIDGSITATKNSGTYTISGATDVGNYFSGTTALSAISATTINWGGISGLPQYFPPSSGSTFYIQNQYAVAQPANFWIDGNITGGAVKSAGTFVSGFAGSGTMLNLGTNEMTLDKLTVRGEMNVYELIINKIRATNGSLWVSDAVKFTSVDAVIGQTQYCYVDSDTDITFAINDVVKAQNFNGRSVKVASGVVVDITGTRISINLDNTANPFWVNAEVVRIGNTTNTNRQGALYLTSSDNNSPYLDILNGVTSTNFSGKTKVRLGRLDGIVDANFGGALSGYGLYCQNGYFSGAINVTGGNAATTTDVSTAQSTAISTASTDASTKVNTLDTTKVQPLQTSVSTIQTTLADFSSDDKITPIEKQSILLEWNVIISEKTKIDSQADTFAVSKTAYGSTYTALSTYIGTNLSNLTTTWDLGTGGGVVMRTKFNDYYNAKTDILNTIAVQAKTQAISAAASDATTKANNAQSTAISTASTDATTKANNAYSGAVSTASTDASTKANNAQTNAINTAANDATTKANNAQSAAISSAQSFTNSAITTLKTTYLGDIAVLDTLDGGLITDSTIALAKLGNTIISGGLIKTTLLDASAIKATIINTGYIEGLALNFTQGNIGGWNINSTYLAKDNASNSAGLAPLDYPFYAGNTYANRAIAPFRVASTGEVNITSKCNIKNTSTNCEVLMGGTELPFGFGSGALYVKGTTTNSSYDTNAIQAVANGGLHNFAIQAQATGSGYNTAIYAQAYGGTMNTAISAEGNVLVNFGGIEVKGTSSSCGITLPLESIYSTNTQLSSYSRVFYIRVTAADGDVFLPSISDFKIGEMIYLSNSGTRSVWVRSTVAENSTINGFNRTTRYLTMSPTSSGAVLAKQSNTNWCIVSYSNTQF